MSHANGTIGEIIKALDMAAAEMLVITLPKSRIVDATQCLCRRWGASKYDMIGKQLSQTETAPFYARYIDVDLSGPGSGANAQIEVTCRLSGSPVSTLFRPQFHRSGTHEFLLLVGVSGAEAQRAASVETETRLQLAVRAGGYAMWDFDLKRQSGNFAPEIYDMLGLVASEGGLSLASWNDRAHRDDRMRTVDAWLAASSGDAGYMRHRYRILHEAGHYVWIELIASLIKDPITSKPVKAIGLARDITDEMAAIHRIEVSEQNLVRSQAVARIGSWVHDLATGTSEWTDQMYVVFDLDKSEPTQDFDTLFAVIQDDHLERWADAFDKAAEGHTVLPFEINITSRDGKTRRIRTHIDPEYDSDGSVGRLHGICQDITDQRLMERKFLQAQKMEAVGRLTGGIAHDFNNLLMVVMGNLQLAESACADDSKLAKRVGAAMDAATRGSELTRRLLAFSRQQTLEDEEIDVNALVLDTRDMLIRSIGEQIKLEIRTGNDVWPIATDRTQLETALLNLAINARHAMELGGTLTIETANAQLSEDDVHGKVDVRPGDYVLIRVSDTGHGMPAEIIDKVIQPFFTTKGPEAGSGLGLSMIYGFVTQSGGHLAIESEVGSGTTMSIYLPRLGSHAPAASVSPQWDDQTTSGPHECHPAAAPPDFAQARTPAPCLYDADARRDGGHCATSAGELPLPTANPSRRSPQRPRQWRRRTTLPSPKRSTRLRTSLCRKRSAAPDAQAPEPASHDNTVEAAAPSVDQHDERAATAGNEKREAEAEAAPAIESEAAIAAAVDAAPEPATQPAAPRRVVLVVEDNHQVRDVAVAMIEDTGLEVLDAASGEDALAIIEARPDIDLMLSDVVMPGMGGPELAARALTMRPDLKVLFASGYTAGNLEEVPGLPKGLELINKPFTRDDLVGSVTRALDAPAVAA